MMEMKDKSVGWRLRTRLCDGVWRTELGELSLKNCGEKTVRRICEESTSTLLLVLICHPHLRASKSICPTK